MTDRRIPSPLPGEYAPPYEAYVAAAAGTDVRALLERQIVRLQAACAPLSEEEARYRYAPSKWSIKEVIGHLGDSERVFAYRALRIGRGDATPLPGFDENAFVAGGGFDDRTLGDLLEELASVRAATLRLFDGMAADAWERRGQASGAEVSVRALAYIIAGHTEHHLRILAERYGVEGAAVSDRRAPL